MSQVTCLLVTRGRAPLAKLAARNALEQTYRCEVLVVCDNIVQDFPWELDDRVRVVAAPSGDLLDKRHWALRQVQTPYLAFWDDDNWFPDNRIESQMEAIGQLYATGTRHALMWEFATGLVYHAPSNPNRPRAASVLTRTDNFLSVKRDELGQGWVTRWLYRRHHEQMLCHDDWFICMGIHHDTMTDHRRRRPHWVKSEQRVPQAWLEAYRAMRELGRKRKD